MKKRTANYSNKRQSPLAFPQRLTEKYAPQRIEDFCGMDKPKKVLAAFARAPRADSFILVGESGLGKTEMARAFARAIGAELHHIASQEGTVENVLDTIRRCWYAPMAGPDGWHVILFDEADRMSNAAQLALLSKLDSTDPPPQTIFLFTCNSTSGLERRFLSRCKVLEFDRRTVNGDLTALMKRIWRNEAPEDAPLPDFDLIENDACGNVRDALNKLELEILAA